MLSVIVGDFPKPSSGHGEGVTSLPPTTLSMAANMREKKKSLVKTYLLAITLKCHQLYHSLNYKTKNILLIYSSIKPVTRIQPQNPCTEPCLYKTFRNKVNIKLISKLKE